MEKYEGDEKFEEIDTLNIYVKEKRKNDRQNNKNESSDPKKIHVEIHEEQSKIHVDDDSYDITNRGEVYIANSENFSQANFSTLHFDKSKNKFLIHQTSLIFLTAPYLGQLWGKNTAIRGQVAQKVSRKNLGFMITSSL